MCEDSAEFGVIGGDGAHEPWTSREINPRPHLARTAADDEGHGDGDSGDDDEPVMDESQNQASDPPPPISLYHKDHPILGDIFGSQFINCDGHLVSAQLTKNPDCPKWE